MLDNCSGGLGSKETEDSDQDSCEYLGAVVDKAKESLSPEDPAVCLRCNSSDQSQFLDQVFCLCQLDFHQNDIRNKNTSAEPRDPMRIDNPGKAFY